MRATDVLSRVLNTGQFGPGDADTLIEAIRNGKLRLRPKEAQALYRMTVERMVVRCAGVSWDASKDAVKPVYTGVS